MSMPIYQPSEIAAGARTKILECYDRYVAAAKDIGATPSRASFVRRYNDGQIKIEPWVKDAFPSISYNSVDNWLKRRASEGNKALLGRYGKRMGQTIIATDPKLRKAVEAILEKDPKISAKKLFERIADQGTKKISLRTVTRYLAAHRP